MKNIAIAGVGAWGRNLLRNFHTLADGHLVLACDGDEKRLRYVNQTYPDLKTTKDYNDVIKRDDIEAVVLATPPAAHFEMAMAAIKADKDVFVEKPLVLSVAEGEQLVEEADKRKRVLMVGHIMVYHPATLYLKEKIDSGDLGTVYYLCASRVNLGKVRNIENALWSFAPHDISIILFLLQKMPVQVTSTGSSYLQPGIEDVVFTVLHFADGTMAHIHVSWLDPRKDRKLVVVGSEKMAEFDDSQAAEKIRLYDKTVNTRQDYETYGEYLAIRTGDIVIPRIKTAEPLAEECRHFLDCIETRTQPRSDGVEGLRVLKVLDAAQQSLAKSGAPIKL
ncbi:MAG: Gfo/Idh/MocA family oxidoreductase [candidate division Zixibacteria bacterium]|nr:Gfo/Idh/MocA family oxidoreductase [candidate division Zixibacteria bacterium]MDH3937683.1 Gfo/Idh/MocA family oxidoreductase [candidate division Zixibacteria bacterium]MDH4032324.1 Gfo/Idh/MocA family oxidoreductase [candidate division Zixibacteria bacterium]